MARVTRSHAITDIVFGVLEIIMGVVYLISCSLVTGPWYSLPSSYYVAGSVFIIPGIFGIISGATKNNGFMITFLVFSIVACVMLIIGSVRVCIPLVQLNFLSDITTNCTGDYCSALTTIEAGIWGMVVSCFLSAVITLGSSILGCVSACCTPAERNGLILQEYPVAVGGFAEPPQYQTPEVFQLPETQAKSGIV